MCRNVFRLLAALLVLGSGSVAAQTLYGIAFVGPDGASTLYSIAPSNGAATAIGPVGFERCSGMDSRFGVMLATCERADDSDTPVLVQINLQTGAGTEIGPHGFSGAISDISVRPTDGALFAYDATNDPDHSLLRIDTTSGAGTLVGDTGLDFAGGNSLSFNLSGVLYHSQLTSGPSPDLNSFNPTNGQPTLLGMITPVTGRFSAMDVHPVTGVLFGLLNAGDSGAGPVSLATINPGALTATVLGVTTPGMDALAFGEAPAVPPALIPTLDLRALTLMLLMVSLVGAVVLLRVRNGS